MSRLHLFEFEDQVWFPAVLRDLLTETLTMGTLATGRYDGVAPLVHRLLRAGGTSHVVDLCSGASGPWARLAGQLSADVPDLRVTLTDLYPNVATMKQVSALAGASVTYEAEPVDATRPPSHLSGVRTLFSAFHHFRPPLARAILASAARDRVPIGVFEHTARTVRNVVAAPVVAPLRIARATPRMPFSWKRVALTYALPVVPFVTAWDGTVSHLRTYSPAELRALVDAIDAPAYRWEVGQAPSPGGHPLTWLIGEPT